ncbi:ABC-type transport system ATP-binding protein [Natrialba magadii ATCC 43099]|uniref:ABC transporter n=1 Tax=Natrialba magadii (strain ATCC 43099 / DSM 3394 / CCM 3739 / CIP 104546 / IAM 13178 / JCM 8861 / NBRC 102185 / NCIMB 2190 / MS3) TaxID=547559 RepID=D3SSK4_NATMM|nr:ABC transporter ATP-binding protein [Natrialba magadii]ADD06849.1 ABC-type transport system ATP-binding protein [Natrialba magadii ATCC 43099]ELY28223.1 ABC transporter [Natrialba magadii ATCC 43099]
MTAVVEATALEKRYGETVALSGASLSIPAGEVFGLIGPNGAGKTTLVRALTGTTEPDSGTATVLDESPTAIDRDRLGVLPQDFSPPDRLTARELLAYYAGLYDDPRDPDAVLADVGLADTGDTWYEDLSGGQQRRVCVGSTLVNDPDVLFLDEPTTGIDPAGRRTVWRLIEELAAGGTTVLLTTHDMAEAERLADRVGLLADGSLIAQGTPDALVAEYGGSSRLEIETAADPEAFAELEYPVERAQSRSRTAADGTVSSSTPTDTLVVQDIGPAAIGTVVDALERQGLEYTSLSWTEPDLEDVYLELADRMERERTESAGESGEKTSDGESAADVTQTGETA